jgi:hypothetical protein
LEHVEFDLEMDNQALMWCLSHSRQLGTIARWAVQLFALKFHIHHIRGSQNIIADILSRMYYPDAQVLVTPILLQFPILFEDIATHQRSDTDLKIIIGLLSVGDTPVILYKKVSFIVRRVMIVAPR